MAESVKFSSDGVRVTAGVCWRCRWTGTQFTGRGSKARADAECREHEADVHIRFYETIPDEVWESR